MREGKCWVRVKITVGWAKVTFMVRARVTARVRVKVRFFVSFGLGLGSEGYDEG